jgi:excisionase family DNA binding protein
MAVRISIGKQRATSDRMPTELLTVKQAAAFSKVSDQSIRRWIKFGDLKTYRAGRQVRIDKMDLVDFLSGQ